MSTALTGQLNSNAAPYHSRQARFSESGTLSSHVPNFHANENYFDRQVSENIYQANPSSNLSDYKNPGNSSGRQANYNEYDRTGSMHQDFLTRSPNGELSSQSSSEICDVNVSQDDPMLERGILNYLFPEDAVTSEVTSRDPYNSNDSETYSWNDHFNSIFSGRGLGSLWDTSNENLETPLQSGETVGVLNHAVQSSTLWNSSTEIEINRTPIANTNSEFGLHQSNNQYDNYASRSEDYDQWNDETFGNPSRAYDEDANVPNHSLSMPYSIPLATEFDTKGYGRSSSL